MLTTSSNVDPVIRLSRWPASKDRTSILQAFNLQRHFDLPGNVTSFLKEEESSNRQGVPDEILGVRTQIQT